MIRFFVLTGLIGGLAVAYLTTAGVGPITQLPPPKSLLTDFREKGYVPESASLEEDEAAEELHVFEVPDEDAIYLAEAEAAFEAMMGSMDMSSMDMGTADGATMDMADGSTMDMSTTEGATMDMADGSTMDMSTTEGATMDMTDGSTMDMSTTEGATMDMAEGSTMDMSTTEGATMDMAEGSTMDMSTTEGATMDMAEGSTMDMSTTDGAAMDMGEGSTMEMGEGGLLVTEDGDFDREIVLIMTEWEFSDMQIDVKMGERIKFTVKNGGQIPHEFMFMSPPLMQAVNYRTTRADWSLFEHEALFEKPLVLPDGEFSFVLQVQQPGSWMFMCMLPYHMQMGMMGQMATEGMAMDM